MGTRRPSRATYQTSHNATSSQAQAAPATDTRHVPLAHRLPYSQRKLTVDQRKGLTGEVIRW